MNVHTNSQTDAQACEVLQFMARNVQSRPMLHGLLMSDLHRWDKIPAVEKPKVFQRDVRRFSVACPHLAGKDRIKHALEALTGQDCELTENLFLNLD